MAIPTWVWIAGAGGAIWYVNEKNKVELAANRGVSGAIDHASKGANSLIDETLSAAGKWVSSFFGGGGSSSGASYRPDSYSANDPSYGDDNGYTYTSGQGSGTYSWGPGSDDWYTG